MSHFAKKIKYLREKKGETQEQIAKLLSISKATVCKYESGERQPDIEAIKTLSRHFNVSVDFILGLTDNSDQHCIYSSGSSASLCCTNLSPASEFKGLERLAAKIKYYNLDIVLVERIIDNVLMLKKSNQKHP